uniref:Uncharacterized protein n=1 Tax=Arundo donax TaxID=35708 RepID=A0A0A9HBN4_ARUDO
MKIVMLLFCINQKIWILLYLWPCYKKIWSSPQGAKIREDKIWWQGIEHLHALPCHYLHHQWRSPAIWRAPFLKIEEGWKRQGLVQQCKKIVWQIGQLIAKPRAYDISTMKNGPLITLVLRHFSCMWWRNCWSIWLEMKKSLQCRLLLNLKQVMI